MGIFVWVVPVGLRVSGESMVTINLGDTSSGTACRESQAPVLYA